MSDDHTQIQDKGTIAITGMSETDVQEIESILKERQKEFSEVFYIQPEFKVSDEDIFDAVFHHIQFLNQRISNLTNRVSESLERMKNMDKSHG